MQFGVALTAARWGFGVWPVRLRDDPGVVLELQCAGVGVADCAEGAFLAQDEDALPADAAQLRHVVDYGLGHLALINHIMRTRVGVHNIWVRTLSGIFII